MSRGSIWRVFHAGAWRPVTHMLRGQQEVRHPEQATAVVLEVDGEYLATPISPGEIFSEWLPELPPPEAWTRID